MRITELVLIAAVVGGLSSTVMAQTPTTTPLQPTPTSQQTPTGIPTIDPYRNHWTVSAFAGSNFGTGRHNEFGDLDVVHDDTSVTFGGQVAYLWRGYVGAEALVDFSPSFQLNNLFFEDNPDVNTYMANAIAGVPLGSENQYFPYISGGFGGIQMRATLFTLNPAETPNVDAIGTIKSNASRFGGNIGGGIMGFSRNVGFRGDVRYYRTSADNNVDLLDAIGDGHLFTQGALSGLAFWKVNVGVAFRF
jgi:hypothetical protein